MVDVKQPIAGIPVDRINKALNYYLSQGLSPRGAAYMVGNMIQESSLLPDNPAFDQGTGYAASEGLLQWTFDRKAGMPLDFDGQLAFALKEMDRDYGGAGLRAKLSDPNTPPDVLIKGFKDWIRWGEIGSRFQYGDQIYALITGQPLPAVSKSSLPGDYSSTASSLSGVNQVASGLKSAILNGDNCDPPAYTQQARIVYTGCTSKISSAIQGSSGTGHPAPGVGSTGNAEPGIGSKPYPGQLKPGAFINPMKKEDYIVTSEFGPRDPSIGSSSFHWGIDLAGDEGKPIYAAADGTAKLKPNNGDAGNEISIEHPDGSLTRYLHMSAYVLSSSGPVKQGQHIGKVGTTGGSTGPHLHFEYAPPGQGNTNPRTIIDF